mmetsp:Transcript_23919/g.51166  ORF Transcript_23919/g.51166 Transcript_23919/m.51166 type:complete len:218 (-) Transcript_23919:388-1041(-)
MDWEGRSGPSDGEGDEFVTMLIKGSKVGFETRKTRHPTAAAAQQQQQEQRTPQSQEEKEERPVSATVRAARRLFFRERAALLATLSDLVRHRVEAADGIAASPSSKLSVVLAATDQLLKAGLSRELTAQMIEIGETLKATERNRGDAPATAPAPAAPAFGEFGGGGLFGANATPAPAAAPAAKPRTIRPDVAPGGRQVALLPRLSHAADGRRGGGAD